MAHMPVKSCPYHGYYHGTCPDCTTQRNKRPSSTTRGYGQEHRRLRDQYRYLIKTVPGAILCSRCGNSIWPNDKWDLDHTDDRQGYKGPSHATCNRART